MAGPTVSDAVAYATTPLGLAAILVALSLLWILQKWIAFKQKVNGGASKIPGPVPSFPFGSLGVMIEHGPLNGFKAIIDQGDREAGVSRAIVGGSEMVLVTHADDLKKVFQASSHHVSEKNSTTEETNFSKWFQGGESVVMLGPAKHQQWVQVRRVVGRSFVSTAIRPMVHPMTSVQLRACDYLAKEAKRSTEPIRMDKVLTAMTLDILGKSAFSTDFGALDKLQGGKTHPFEESLNWLQREVDKRNNRTSLMPWLKPKNLWIPLERNRLAKKYKAMLDNEIKKLIGERRALMKSTELADEEVPHDFMQVLMNASDGLTPKQVLSNLITLIDGGFGTSSVTLQNALRQLAVRPEIQEKIKEEVDSVWPSGTPATEETYRALEYTHCVIKETLRLTPPMLTARTAPKDVQLGKYTVPKGVMIICPLYWSMRDPYNWRDPEVFKPERFSKHDKASPSDMSDVDEYDAFMPFGHGRRSCIGQRFALMSTTLALAALCRRFEFTLPDDFVCNLELLGSVLLRPKGGLPMYLKERVNA